MMATTEAAGLRRPAGEQVHAHAHEHAHEEAHEDAHIAAHKDAHAVAALRDTVLAQWSTRVRTEIGAAGQLAPSILMNTVPILYNNLVEALSTGAPRAFATSGTTLSTAHGRERASNTDYCAHEVVHELQLLRETVLAVCAERGLLLSRADVDVIVRSLDLATRDAVAGYNAVVENVHASFAARLSHDLRNPLNVASATAQLVGLKTGDPNIAGLARRVVRKIEDADAVVTALRDAAVLKLRSRLPLQLTRFDIMHLVEEVCGDLPLLGQPVRPLGERVTGYWCRASMKQALESVLANARRYAPPGVPVTVQVATLHERMLLSVHNAGAPIAEPQLARLFDADRRLRDAAAEGWGPGLPYVQHVLESHGGSVYVDSGEGRGTTFTLAVPVDARPWARQADAAPAST